MRFNPAATAGNFVMLCGDWDGYRVVDRIGATIELVPHLFDTTNNRPTGQRGFLLWWRVGGDTVNDNALRMLSIPTTA